MDALAILVSVLSLCVSWKAYSLTVNAHYKKQIILHQKLLNLFGPIRQFILYARNPAFVSYGGKIHIPFETDSLKDFELEKDEKNELAVMDVAHNPPNVRLAGLPLRIEKWYSQKGVANGRVFEKEYVLDKAQLDNMHQTALALLRDCDLVLTYLEKDMPASVWFQFKKNEYQDRKRVKENRKNIVKQIADMNKGRSSNGFNTSRQ